MTPSLRATLRLQFHRGFTFDDAVALVPYFAALGISHVYASPILRARRGSLHGYDGVDPRQINPELGGEDGLRRLVAALRAAGMGLILDIVPNHMAIGAENPWWMDLLEWGPDSRYASFFDIDWDVPDPRLRGRLLAPFLGRPCGEALAAGEIVLRCEHGRFAFHYFAQRYPLAARDYAPLLRLHGGAAAALAADFVTRGRTRQAAFEQARARLAQAAQDDAAVARDLAALCAGFGADTAEGLARLERLLERQHYRLAWWRTAADEINWRRFFDISELIALRTQRPPVFEATHACLLGLYAEGLVDGLRVDHVDGLADPRRYCRLLRARTRVMAAQRPPEAMPGPAYLVVEKILAPGEKLPQDWQMDGTSGYVFMDQVGALLHDPAGEAELTRLWRERSNGHGDFHAEVRRARRRLAQELFAADLRGCVHALHQVALLEARSRDWSAAAIRRVLLELLVQFPVYRTYADGRGRTPEDTALMAACVEAARPHCRAGERPLLDEIDRWLGGEPAARHHGAARQARLHALARFQQLTAPLAAKAVEDTAFYRHGRLLSRNEVGADPAQFALSTAAFHEACLERRQRYPRAMLATATHDHKRGEDLRARLAVLSEIPQRWGAQVQAWTARHASLRHHGAPDGIDEYILYQMLVGAWPLDLRAADAAGLARFHARIEAWQQKAVREAKRHSGWIDPDPAYEDACRRFLGALFESAEFLRELQDLVDGIAAAGAVNGLVQTLLRLTTPGVPDLYQGTEFWDFSLVDPDNRRPVDFAARQRAMAAARPLAELLRQWRDGHIKQQLIARALRLRVRHPDLFLQGRYRPLRVGGEHAAHLLAFLREHGDSLLLVVVPRHVAALLPEAAHLDLADAAWGDTRLQLPTPLLRRLWHDCLSEAPDTGLPAPLHVAALLRSGPVALWLG